MLNSLELTQLTCDCILNGHKAKLFTVKRNKDAIFKASTNHRLHGGARDHELHLLSQHGGGCLLLDQVISSVDLELGLQVSRWVEVFAVLSRATALSKDNREREREDTQINPLTV